MTSRLIPALVVLLVATGAWAAPAKQTKPAAEPPVTVESLLSQAHDAFGKGDTELAVRLAQSAIVADPARTSLTSRWATSMPRPGRRTMRAPSTTKRWESTRRNPTR